MLGQYGRNPISNLNISDLDVTNLNNSNLGISNLNISNLDISNLNISNLNTKCCRVHSSSGTVQVLELSTSIVHINSQGPLNSSYTRLFNYSSSVSILQYSLTVSSTPSQILLQWFIANSMVIIT